MPRWAMATYPESKPMQGYPWGMGELTNIVVGTNESDYNPQAASLMTMAGEHARKPQISGWSRSYSYSYYVLLECSLPANQKTTSFREFFYGSDACISMQCT